MIVINSIVDIRNPLNRTKTLGTLFSYNVAHQKAYLKVHYNVAVQYNQYHSEFKRGRPIMYRILFAIIFPLDIIKNFASSYEVHSLQLIKITQFIDIPCTDAEIEPNPSMYCDTTFSIFNRTWLSCMCRLLPVHQFPFLI